MVGKLKPQILEISIHFLEVESVKVLGLSAVGALSQLDPSLVPIALKLAHKAGFIPSYFRNCESGHYLGDSHCASHRACRMPQSDWSVESCDHRSCDIIGHSGGVQLGP